MKKLVIGALCAIAIGFLGCSDSNSKSDSNSQSESGSKNEQEKVSVTILNQSDPMAVAKAWFTALTEGNLERLLALTVEEDRKQVKDGRVQMISTFSAKYKGKPITVSGNPKAPNEPMQIVEKGARKYAFVNVDIGADDPAQYYSEPCMLVLKDGKWFYALVQR